MRPSLRQVLFRSVGLDLNFAGGVFSLTNTRTDTPAAIPGWSFSRTDTNGTATALDLAGNVIRFPSRTNLLLQSQTFDDASWTKGGSTVTANATAAPDESITADKLVEDTSTGLHRLQQTVTKAASAQTYTFTVFAKTSERTQLRLTLDDVGANNGGATFNLSDGTISTAAAVAGDFTNASASITAVGSWYRLSLTVTSNTITSIRAQTQIAVSGSVSYTGTAGSGLFLWGAQLETGSTATDYIPTTTAAVTVVLPRITNRGILVEEARTNSFLQSNTFSDAAWVAVGAKNVVANNVIGPDGTLSASTLSDVSAVAFQGISQTITVPNDTASRSFSIFVKKTSGGTSATFGVNTAFTGGTAANANIRLNTDTGATSFSNATGSAVSVGGFWWLQIVQANNGQGNTNHSINIYPAAGVNGSFADSSAATGSAVIYQADNQLGAFATSPIITTGAAGTRGADVPVLTLSDSAAYTIIADGFGSPGTTTAILTSRDDTTSNNRVQIGNAGQVITYGATAGGVAEFFITTATTSIPSFKAAVRVAVNNAAVAINGSIVQTDTVFAVPVTTRLAVGIDRLNGAPFNSYIRRVQVLPYAVTDAQLQALTAP